ncbi:Low molecular weight protein tyrosine phosphatase [hydrothermal vent metagenome]|uniref:protein-tyrosine-phosphatase n=1 Tax=hydrothermal vent metagenome TaxID=652676 RepID=A0A1W1BFI3_9ZZZZ
MKNSILFVCLGNICRSPLAEGIAKAYAKEKGIDLFIDSAGTGSWHIGEAPCDGSQRVAKMHGIDISSHRARQISKEDIAKFDIIVALDSKNRADLEAMGAVDVLRLGDFGYNGADVPDPYFFDGFEGFLEVYDMCEKCTRNLIDEYSK